MAGSSEPAETDASAVGANDGEDDDAPDAQALGAKYPALLSIAMQEWI